MGSSCEDGVEVTYSCVCGLSHSNYYSPTRAEKIRTIYPIIDRAEELIASHYNSENRVGTVSVRLLQLHTKFIRKFADALILKAEGRDAEAIRSFKLLEEELCQKEHLFAKYLDLWLIIKNYSGIIKQVVNPIESEF